jgi:hypothetical protein
VGGERGGDLANTGPRKWGAVVVVNKKKVESIFRKIQTQQLEMKNCERVSKAPKKMKIPVVLERKLDGVQECTAKKWKLNTQMI